MSTDSSTQSEVPETVEPTLSAASQAFTESIRQQVQDDTLAWRRSDPTTNEVEMYTEQSESLPTTVSHLEDALDAAVTTFGANAQGSNVAYALHVATAVLKDLQLMTRHHREKSVSISESKLSDLTKRVNALVEEADKQSISQAALVAADS